MPKGGRRLGAGRKRKPLSVHLMAGTYRHDRHGPLPSAAATAPILARQGPVPDVVAAGLTGAGLAFLTECWTTYAGWDPPSIVVLREAAYLITELEGLRGQRGERAAQRLLLSTLAALRLED